MDASDGLALESGRRIDRYEIRELIGRGATGVVYRAVDTRLGRTVALKAVVAAPGGGALDDAGRERILSGVRAVSTIDHRNLAHVLDFGLADGAVPYVVTEHLRGDALDDLLRSRGGALTVPEAADIVLAVCAALRACHARGVAHGALRPRKIFLEATDTGREVKLRDAGLSAAPAEPGDDLRAAAGVLEACLADRMTPVVQAIVRRAAGATPGERYDSVHALGDALCELASPPARERWRRSGARAAALDEADVSTPGQPSMMTQILAPAKELEPTPFLPEAREPRPDPGTLFLPVAGGTAIDLAPDSTGPEAPPVTATERVRRPRPILPLAGAAVGGLLLAGLVVTALTGRPDRRHEDTARPAAPRVTPSEEAIAPPTAAAPSRPGPPPHTVKNDEPSRQTAPPPHPKRSSRSRSLRNVDAQGIGIAD